MTETLRQELEILYGHKNAAGVEAKIRERIGGGFGASDKNTFSLTEKDSVLITYGDIVRSDGATPLATLGEFLREFVKDAVSSVHLLPFYPYSSDDGFSVMDYLEVDEKLGSWEDVESLSRDYSLMFDAVINHASAKGKWFGEFLRGNEKYREFFLCVDEGFDISNVVRPRTHPLLTRFETAEGSVHAWTTFSDDQVDLNFQSPDLLLAVLDVLLEYVRRGARLIRMDAIAFLWKKSGTSCIHLEETHALIRLFRKVLDEAAPGTIVITETNVPHRENISYFGDGSNEAHMVYNFSLPPLLAHAVLTADAGVLTEWASGLELPSGQTSYFNFTASHDGVGVRPVEGILDERELTRLVEATLAHGGRVSMRKMPDGSERPYELNCVYMDLLSDPTDPDYLRASRFLITQAVMLAMPGVPGIYFHSLVGSCNDIRGMEYTGRNRSINREKVRLSELKRELAKPDSLRSKVFYPYLEMLKIRRERKEFHPCAPFAFFSPAKSVFVVERKTADGSSAVLCLNNLGAEAVEISLPADGSGAKDLLQGREPSADGKLKLEPYSAVWLAR